MTSEKKQNVIKIEEKMEKNLYIYIMEEWNKKKSLLFFSLLNLLLKSIKICVRQMEADAD